MNQRTIVVCFVAALVLIGGLFVYGMNGTPPSRPPGPQDAAMEKNRAVADEARQNVPPNQRQTTGAAK